MHEREIKVTIGQLQIIKYASMDKFSWFNTAKNRITETLAGSLKRGNAGGKGPSCVYNGVQGPIVLS